MVVCCWLAVGFYDCVFWETLPSLLKCNLQIMSIDCFCFGKLLFFFDFHSWKIWSIRKGCVTLQRFVLKDSTSTIIDSFEQRSKL